MAVGCHCKTHFYIEYLMTVRPCVLRFGCAICVAAQGSCKPSENLWTGKEGLPTLTFNICSENDHVHVLWLLPFLTKNADPATTEHPFTLGPAAQLSSDKRRTRPHLPPSENSKWKLPRTAFCPQLTCIIRIGFALGSSFCPRQRSD